MATVPFLDLKSQYLSIKSEIDSKVIEVLGSTAYILGPEVAAFEQEFADYVGAKHAIACNSGTSALHLALLAAGIGPGDEVITIPMTFIATVSAIRYTGATPVFVDVLPDTRCMDPDQIEAKITSRTKAIMPVHLYGQSADMTAIEEVASRHGIPVIEDAAQAHGASHRGRKCGSMGLAAGFSFYPGKNLGAYGEGGAVTTNDDAICEKVKILRDWGQDKRYHHKYHAFNYRMDGIQGAILRIKLRHLEEWTEARRSVARKYGERLHGVDAVLPSEAEGNRHVYHIYGILNQRRDELQTALTAAEVQTGLHYPVPVHLQEAYADLGFKPGDFPISESISAQELSLPMHADLTDSMIDQVCDAVAKAVASQKSLA